VGDRQVKRSAEKNGIDVRCPYPIDQVGGVLTRLITLAKSKYSIQVQGDTPGVERFHFPWRVNLDYLRAKALQPCKLDVADDRTSHLSSII
jgi:hypothetical protein